MQPSEIYMNVGPENLFSVLQLFEASLENSSSYQDRFFEAYERVWRISSL